MITGSVPTIQFHAERWRIIRYMNNAVLSSHVRRPLKDILPQVRTFERVWKIAGAITSMCLQDTCSK